MKKFQIFTGTSYMNSVEGTFGDIFHFADTIVIPFHNVQLVHDVPEKISSAKNLYIDFCYLAFVGVNTFTNDFTIGEETLPKTAECLGGDYFFTDKFEEFWIDATYSFSILPVDFKVSKSGWNIEKADKPFFAYNQDIEKLKIYLTNMIM